ncbi:MAG: H-X9-DG-CTERM domain-containing protein [Planctomycetota bacterium]
MDNPRTAGEARRKWIEAVVVAVIVVLLLTMVAIVIRHTHEASLTLRCRRRLISLFTAVQHYALSYGGHPPGQGAGAGGNWRGLIVPLLDAGEQGRAEREQILQCPAGGTYVGNRNILASGKTLSSFRLTLEVGVFADGGGGAAEAGGSASFEWRHDGGVNVVFLDGHVERVTRGKSVRVRRHWDTPQ